MKFGFALLVLFTCFTAAQGQYKATVLADVFTNSHCSACASMYKAVDLHITNTVRKSNVIMVFNHVSTYQDDPIYQANKTQPIQRAQWYGGVNSTPSIFFGGSRTTGGYSSWPAQIDALLEKTSAYEVVPVLTTTQDSLILTYRVTRAASGPTSPALYGVLVENIAYQGRNGVSSHDGALRQLFTPVQGDSLVFNNQNVATGRLAIARNATWNVEKLRVVVSVQDPTTKKSLQAAQVEAQMATDVHDETFVASGPATADVVDVRGSIVSRHEGLLIDNVGIVSQVTRTLPSGAYFVRIVRGTSVTVRSIVIAR